MTSSPSPSSLNRENAVLLLENMLLRERLDLKAWDTRQMRKNVATMKEIVERASWGDKEAKTTEDLKGEIEKLLTIIQNKDATLVDAGHTHVERAVSELRKSVFGF